MSAAEDALAACFSSGEWRDVPPPAREFRFHATRRWRFDFAWPAIKLAVEIDGRGRHQTVTGVRSDCEKANEAIRLGWRVLRFPATDYRQARQWARTIVEVMCGVGDLE